MIISNISSALVYIATIYLFPEQLSIVYMDAKFFFYVIIIVGVSWLPLFIAKLILRKTNPSDY